MNRTESIMSSTKESRRPEQCYLAGKGKPALLPVALAAILMLLHSATAQAFNGFKGKQNAQFLPLVVSTVPANGDQNPYGVVFVPSGFHSSNAQPGDILVSNFNNGSNLQGTGTTIVRVQPNGQISVFANTGTVTGLTDALGVSKKGFVLVGSVPTTDGTFHTVSGGPLLVLDNNGHVVDSITSPLDGPWGLALNDTDHGVTVYVSNVLNGTVTRLDFSLSKGSLTLSNSTQIASGYSHTTDKLAIVIGPAGLAYNSQTDSLYVAAEDDDKIFAIPNASQATDKGEGTLVFSDPHLRGPLGLAFAPNGDLLAANNDSINSDPTQPSEIVEFTIGGKFVSEFSIDSNIDGPFGIAIEDFGSVSQFAYLDDNLNTLTVWRVGTSPSDDQ